MAESVFRGVISFFGDIGLYDVVLPFLLVFTIVFAILEKTKVFGVEEIEGKKYTRKNLNAMASFVIAFLVSSIFKHNVSGSTSTKTGMAPNIFIEFGVAIIV